MTMNDYIVEEASPQSNMFKCESQPTIMKEINHQVPIARRSGVRPKTSQSLQLTESLKQALESLVCHRKFSPDQRQM